VTNNEKVSGLQEGFNIQKRVGIDKDAAQDRLFGLGRVGGNAFSGLGL